jgi:hypothetical protein
MNDNERRAVEAMDKFAEAVVRWYRRQVLCQATVDDARAVIDARAAALDSVVQGMDQVDHDAFLAGVKSVERRL